MHLSLSVTTGPSATGSTHTEIGKPVAKGLPEKPETTFGEMIARHAEEMATQPVAEKANGTGPASAQSAAKPEEDVLTAALHSADAHALHPHAPASTGSARTAAKEASAVQQPAKGAVNKGDGSAGEASAFWSADIGQQTTSVAAHEPSAASDKTSAHEKTSAHNKTSTHDQPFTPPGPQAPAAALAVTARLLPVPVAATVFGIQPRGPLQEVQPTGASPAPSKSGPASSLKGKDTAVVTNRPTPGIPPGGQDHKLEGGTAAGKADAHGVAGTTIAQDGTNPATAVRDANDTRTVTDSAASKQAGSERPQPVDVLAKPVASPVQVAPNAVPVSIASAVGASSQNHLVEARQMQPTAPSPYQRLDQASAPAPVMLHASANRVSVGIHDPALGWIEVKTQAVAGQVSAALVTAAGQSHQSLSAQLPSLTQFLADHEVKVGDVVVQQGNAGGEMSSGSGQRHQQEAGQQSAGTLPAESSISYPETTEALSEARPLSSISIRA